MKYRTSKRTTDGRRPLSVVIADAPPGSSAAPGSWSLISPVFAVIGKVLRVVRLLALAGLVFIIDNTVLHVWLHVCPWHFAHFKPTALVPVVYGYPSSEMLQRAQRGQVVLGGCLVGPVTGVCPHCHWPSRFRSQAKPKQPSH